MSEYIITIEKKGPGYSNDKIVEASVIVPDYPDLGAAQADAVAIVANGALSVFAESMGRIVSELGKRASRDRERLADSQQPAVDALAELERDPAAAAEGEPA